MSDCKTCAEYDFARNYCPKYCEVIRRTLAEITPRWIPVSEMLPKEEKQVLVCNDFGDIYIAEYETFSDGEGRWCESVEYRCLYGIVAWMPLPEPWEGEG